MPREMKDSGIEWIGEIPKEWKTAKMNNVCTVITDYVASGSFASLAENVQYLDEPDYAMLIRTMDISNKGYSGKPVYINEHAYNFLSNSNLFGGEIILPNIGASVGDVYIVPKLYERMSLAPNSIMIRTAECDKYIYYFFYCDAGRMSVIDIAQSTAQPKFNKTDFRQLKISLPPLPEQEKIATFLDSECAKIDEVISKTKSTIDEYKKLKQSVITEAVTKGIRPNREMKDSGIEWIGEIPREWEIIRFKYLHNGMNTGESIDKECWSDDEKDTVFYTAGLLPIYTSYQDFPEWKYTNENDLLLARNGTPYVYYPVINACYTDHIIRAEMKADINRKFVKYSLQQSISSVIVNQVSIATWSASLWNEQTIPWPPLPEQQEIADYLDNKCSEIDTLIAKKEQIITELESYKKSLIYEYVTGKKEVV